MLWRIFLSLLSSQGFVCMVKAKPDIILWLAVAKSEFIKIMDQIKEDIYKADGING